MKTILYLGGFNLPDNNAAAQRVISNAKLFREIGYQVHLIGLSSSIMKGNSEDVFRFEGFDCINIPYPNTIFHWYEYLFTIKWYKKYIEIINPDIVIAYNHPASAMKKLQALNKKQGRLTLSDCTEWYEPQGHFLFRLIKGWDIKQRMYNIHPMLDGIIVISKFLDDFYNKRGIKTLLLPPLVDVEEKKWKIEGVKSGKVIKLVYAGSTGKNKDRLDMIINALELLYNKVPIIFSVIGMTKEQYIKTYDIKRNDIPSFISFLGRLPHVDVIRQLKKSDFQIFLREDNLANRAGFPTKFAESISAGVLVLTNYSSDLKDYLYEGINGYHIDITSVDSLVKSLSIPLKLNAEEINAKKRSIDRSAFDYHNYYDVTKSFIESLHP